MFYPALILIFKQWATLHLCSGLHIINFLKMCHPTLVYMSHQYQESMNYEYIAWIINYAVSIISQHLRWHGVTRSWNPSSGKTRAYLLILFTINIYSGVPNSQTRLTINSLWPSDDIRRYLRVMTSQVLVRRSPPYHGCWWTGNIRNQDIISHGRVLILLTQNIPASTPQGLTHWGRVTHICIRKLNIIGQIMACPEIQNYLLSYESLGPTGHDPYGSQSTWNGSHHWCFYS